METLQFKTNINCSGCIAKITPTLNETNGIENWNVDINNPDKILTISTNKLSEKEVTEVVRKAGFKSELILSI